MESITVVMVREHLDNIPQYPLPAGYRMRLYRPGDKKVWVRLWEASDSLDRAAERFDESFGYDLPALQKRCYFLVAPDGKDVGTITAWYNRNFRGRRWGLIHWVAIIPEYQGKGLSKCMMTVAMNRLRALRHRRAYLRTQTHRIPAIKTYLDFGFLPDMTYPDAKRAWQIVRKYINHPVLARL